MNVPPPKKHLSIRLDHMVYYHVKTKPNASRYIEALVKQDLQMQQRQPIYSAITEQMLKDDKFLALLKQQLGSAGPVVEKVDNELSIVKGDWGA